MYSVQEYINHLKSDFSVYEWKDNISCFIIFGSLVNIPSLTLNKDIDFCIVLKSRDESLLIAVKKYINDHFIDPDVTIYYADELNSNLPFRDIGNGLFALEYLALGTLIYGINIFSQLLSKVSRQEYKKSLIEKIFDYILRIRRTYVIEKDEGDKLNYIKKYLSRLLVDLMIYLDLESLSNLSSLTKEEIFERAIKFEILSMYYQSLSDKDNTNEVAEYYGAFNQVTNKILEIVNEKP